MKSCSWSHESLERRKKRGRSKRYEEGIWTESSDTSIIQTLTAEVAGCQSRPDTTADLGCRVVLNFVIEYEIISKAVL